MTSLCEAFGISREWGTMSCCGAIGRRVWPVWHHGRARRTVLARQWRARPRRRSCSCAANDRAGDRRSCAPCWRGAIPRRPGRRSRRSAICWQAGPESAAPPPARAVAADPAVRAGARTERSVVHRLQGLVPHRRRATLRSPDADRCRQPLSDRLPHRCPHYRCNRIVKFSDTFPARCVRAGGLGWRSQCRRKPIMEPDGAASGHPVWTPSRTSSRPQRP